MIKVANSPASNFLGTVETDFLVDGHQNNEGDVISETSDDPVKVNGLEGDDFIFTTQGDDLAAGDMVGEEWQYIDGNWTYDATAVVLSDYGSDVSFNDIIETGAGNDVLLGNGGNDRMYAGNGRDIINGGRGNDFAYGGEGDDIINLEDGDDFALAGYGADIVNAGDGNDVVFGDVEGESLLAKIEGATSTFNDLVQSGTWTMTDSFGQSVISQTAATVAGETYTISFALAANLAGGRSTGAVDVIWNGEVVDTVQATTGAYETFEIDVTSMGSAGELSFRVIDDQSDQTYNFDGPIISYDKEVMIEGADVSVQAFAPGQANLYQVINGQLNVFDVETETYVSVGEKPSFKINSIGFNAQDDLIYGVAKSSGVDSLGNAVGISDIVMVDANGDTYRIGEGFYGDYVGDFDGSGNLWTFHTALNRVSIVDVDERDSDGNPSITHVHFPKGMFDDRIYDIAFNATDGNFYAVVSPSENSGSGKVIKIDISAVADGGLPTFSELSISGTLFGDQMEAGMASGAYGAVFLDGEGNLYFGLNQGDHDLNGDSSSTGAIYKVNMDWAAGQAYAEFMSEAPSTGSNDGAVDPRSRDAFSEVDADAAVLIQEPTLTLVQGGDDILRGGKGHDELHGNDGNDDLAGGKGDDVLFGDQGDDKIAGGKGDDWAAGGSGNDKMLGLSGNDEMFGNDGTDYLHGGLEDDALFGGADADKVVGGEGSDTINGGQGNDDLWGGDWAGDNSADIFVFDAGTGKDFVHDFEAAIDLIDLTDFHTTYDALQDVATDLGWATVLDLSALADGLIGDKVILLSVTLDDLTQEDFLF